MEIKNKDLRTYFPVLVNMGYSGRDLYQIETVPAEDAAKILLVRNPFGFLL